MIIVTGAAGFIGSCLIAKLNQEGYKDIIAVDLFRAGEKVENLYHKTLEASINRRAFLSWIDKNVQYIDFIYHLGAHTDTTEFDQGIFNELNLAYSKSIWSTCAQAGIPLVYASSAATYGDGSQGFEDNEASIGQLKPLNPYAHSKHDFDCWALAQDHKPPFWAGLKFFNVYGPNEAHKGKMASMIYQAYYQIQENAELKLFKSHQHKFKDGEQRRDFIYVKDVVDVLFHLMQGRVENGIYNLGTGTSRSFNELARILFNVIQKKERISYIEIPEKIRDQYQYETEAPMHKLNSQGLATNFHSLENGIKDYIHSHLIPEKVM